MPALWNTPDHSRCRSPTGRLPAVLNLCQLRTLACSPTPWWTAPAGGLSVAIWRYFGMMHLAARLLEIVESITQSDLNKDGHTGPAPNSAPIALEIVQKNEAGAFQKMFRFTLPLGISDELFTEWARGVTMRNDLTQSRWVSRDKFSRDDYTRLLSLLEESGFVARDGTAKNAAYELLPAGKRALRHYLLAVGDTHSRSLTHMSDDYAVSRGVGD